MEKIFYYHFLIYDFIHVRELAIKALSQTTDDIIELFHYIEWKKSGSPKFEKGFSLFSWKIILNILILRKLFYSCYSNKI